MTQYTTVKLDRRYKLHRAGFELMLVWAWPASSNELAINHPWREYRRYQSIAEKRLGLPYYVNVNPAGKWKPERKYRNVTGGRDVIEERLYIESEKYLTLLQLAI